jgi:type VI protein secretion system component Hcp
LPQRRRRYKRPIETMEVNMTDFVETLADRKAASVTTRELSEAELSTVTGGKTGKVTLNPFAITKVFDKSSPHIFL